MAKKRSSLSLPSSSSSSRGGGGSTVWLDMQEDGELEGGTKVMVTMNKMEEGKGRSKRIQYRSTVTLHGADEQRISGLNRFRLTHSSDPRDSMDAKQELKSVSWRTFNTKSGNEMLII